MSSQFTEVFIDLVKLAKDWFAKAELSRANESFQQSLGV